MKSNEQQKVFDEWMAQCQALLFKVVRAFARTAHDQDDLFQQIALQVWKSIPRYTEDVAVTTWLYRVAFYTANSWKRGETRRQLKTSLLGDHDTLLLQPVNSIDERLESLFEQIAAMPEVDRSLSLMLLDGFSYREMSDVLGISESNVGVRIHRIKKKLTEELKKDDSNEI